jgi:hypothetical protein
VASTLAAHRHDGSSATVTNDAGRYRFRRIQYATLGGGPLLHSISAPVRTDDRFHGDAGLSMAIASAKP